MFLLTELQDLGDATRTGVQDENQGLTRATRTLLIL